MHAGVTYLYSLLIAHGTCAHTVMTNITYESLVNWHRRCECFTARNNAQDVASIIIIYN